MRVRWIEREIEGQYKNKKCDYHCILNTFRCHFEPINLSKESYLQPKRMNNEWKNEKMMKTGLHVSVCHYLKCR